MHENNDVSGLVSVVRGSGYFGETPRQELFHDYNNEFMGFASLNTL